MCKIEVVVTCIVSCHSNSIPEWCLLTTHMRPPTHSLTHSLTHTHTHAHTCIHISHDTQRFFCNDVIVSNTFTYIRMYVCNSHCTILQPHSGEYFVRCDWDCNTIHAHSCNLHQSVNSVVCLQLGFFTSVLAPKVYFQNLIVGYREHDTTIDGSITLWMMGEIKFANGTKFSLSHCVAACYYVHAGLRNL